MVAVILPENLIKRITQHANNEPHSNSRSLSQKVTTVAKSALQVLKDFFECARRSLRSTLLASPLSFRVGLSFIAIPIHYRLLISLTLTAITNLFLATLKYIQLPTRKDPESERLTYEFIKKIFTEKEIKELQEIFISTLETTLTHPTLNHDLKLNALLETTSKFKNRLYQIANHQCLRVLHQEAKEGFSKFWKESFEKFCEAKAQQTVLTFHIATDWEHSLLRDLDDRIVKASLFNPLKKESAIIEVPSDVKFETIYQWFDQIEWNDASSPQFLGPQKDPDHEVTIPKDALKDRIRQAWNFVENRIPTVGVPPVGTKEFDKFYDKLELKTKACIWHLQKEEQRLQEIMAGQPYEALDETTKREYRFLCENKGRLACQIGIAGSHCPVRLNGEIFQQYSYMFLQQSSDDETSSLEDFIKKLTADLRLEITHKEVAKMPPNTHNFVAYMESIGIPFNVPGALDEVEHLTKFSKEKIEELALDFSLEYSPAALVVKVQEHFKKSKSFREKVQGWLEDRAFHWNGDEYRNLFTQLQTRINSQLEHMQGQKQLRLPVMDLFVHILRQIDPNSVVTLNEQTQETATLLDLAKRLENKEISFEDFRNHLIFLDRTKELISSSELFKASKKHPGVFRQNWLSDLSSLNCNTELAELATAILQGKRDPVKQTLAKIPDILTRYRKIQVIKKLINPIGLDQVDYTVLEDEEAFARSLKAAIIRKHKADYLAHCFGDGAEELSLQREYAEALLVDFNILESD